MTKLDKHMLISAYCSRQVTKGGGAEKPAGQQEKGGCKTTVKRSSMKGRSEWCDSCRIKDSEVTGIHSNSRNLFLFCAGGIWIENNAKKRTERV